MAVRIGKNNKTWNVDVAKAGIRFRQNGLSSHDAALMLELQAKQEIEAGRDPNLTLKGSTSPTSRATWREIFRTTDQRYWRSLKSKAMTNNAERLIRRLGDWDGEVATCNQEAVDGLVQRLRFEGCSDSTINRYMSSLRRMLTVAYDGGHLAKIPKLPHFKGYNNRVRYLTQPEEDALLTFMRPYSLWYDFFVVMIDTGARNSELAKVTGFDLSEHGLSFCRTKGNTNRTIPLTKRASDILKVRSLKAGQVGLLFPDYNQSTLGSLWMRLRSYIRLEDDPQFIPYICRHTCASRLVQRGVDLRRVMEWMGHKRIETTLKYAHLAPSSLLSARDVLEVDMVDTELTSRPTNGDKVSSSLPSDTHKETPIGLGVTTTTDSKSR